MAVDYAGLLIQAYEAEGSGIIVESNHPKLLQQQLYEYRREHPNPKFDVLSFKLSRQNTSQLWIINNEKKQEAFKDGDD